MSGSEYTDAVNPASGQVIGRSPLNTVEDLDRAVVRAKQAQPGWAALSPGQRCRYLKGVRDYIVANADDLAAVISQDNGKTRIDALSTEVLPAVMAISYYMKMAKKFLKPRSLMPGNILLANKLARIYRVPFGVLGVISPWNYPFSIPFSEVVMGLLAGNAVILKTASETQMVGRRLEEAFVAAGLPQGVFSYLNLPGRVAGEAFLRGGVDKLFFTGSVAVGKKLMALAAESLTPVSLELGGNDAMLVCPDADLERAAAGAVWAGLSNCGQSCGGVERIYVHRAVYGHFMELLKKKVEALRIGMDLDHRVDLGAMTTQRQMEAVRRHLEDALAKGAVVFAQAQPPQGAAGNFLPASVLSEVTHEMDVMREETFGPVLGVMKVANMEEAVALANDSQLGLTGSVWSKSHGNAKRLARRIKAGAITINDHLMSHGLAETPWGGFKESGIGRTHGKLGFDEMTEPQVVVDDIMPGLRKNMWWHPHGPAVYAGLKGIIDFLYAKSLSARIQGAKDLLKLFPRSFKP
jgi:succinate-semialdehyde dehydrogenase/glutarate-semialdehyde dehydrogenase